MGEKYVCSSHKQGKNKEIICVGFLVNDTFNMVSYPVFQFTYIDYETGDLVTCCGRYERDNLVNPDYFHQTFFELSSIMVPEWITKHFKVLESLFEDVHNKLNQIPF